MSCAVIGCSSVRRFKPEGITFHRFPRGDLFIDWVKKLKLSDKYVWSKCKFVCSRHFRKTDFVTVSNRCYLLPGAVPSLEVSNSSEETRATMFLNEIAQDERVNVGDEDVKRVIEFQCRSCLQTGDTKLSFSMEELILGRTIKSIIQLFIPEMITTSLVPDFICHMCHDKLKTFMNFIERCIEVEDTLKELDNKIRECNTECNSISDSDSIDLQAEELINNDSQPVQYTSVIKDHCYYKKENSKSTVTYDIITDEPISEPNSIQPKPVTLNGSTENTQTATNIPVLHALRGYTVLPHDRLLMAQPPQNFVKMLTDLKASDIDVFKLNLPKVATCNTKGKRVLLLGNHVFRCPICSAQFENHKELISHYKSLHENAPPLPDPRKETFNLFIANNKNRDNVCLICQKNCVSVGMLRQHMQKEHKDYSPYKCERCGRTFRMKDNYQKHIEETKDLDSCDYRKCRICSQMIRKVKYFDHVKRHRNIMCEECGKSFLSVGYLDLHKTKHRFVTKKEKHLCPYCGKLFGESSNLTAHIRSHIEIESPNKYMCDKCPKIFLTSQRLRSHIMKVHTKRRRYECPECNKSCSTRSCLRSHQKLKHSKESQHVCQICGEQFVRGDYFKRHVNRHLMTARGTVQRRVVYKKGQSITPKCKYCEKVCKNIYLLRQHVIMSHLNNMRYKCRYCSFTFANITNRYRHEKRHKDPNFDLICKICWKRMDTKEQLDEHHQKHKQNRKYKCGICSELLPSKYHFLNHMSEVHITEEDIQREKSAVLNDALAEFLIMK